MTTQPRKTDLNYPKNPPDLPTKSGLMPVNMAHKTPKVKMTQHRFIFFCDLVTTEYAIANMESSKDYQFQNSFLSVAE